MIVRSYAWRQKTMLCIALGYAINSVALPKGNSAWLYGKEETWTTQIQRFNAHTSAANRINYLFPETAVVHIDSAHDTLLMTYDPSVTAFYKARLPSVNVIPDLSFWVAHTNFKNWPVDKYQQAADEIANDVNHDPHADGVFLDLESYSSTLLPFYQRLQQDLNVDHKILSVLVRPGQENPTWFRTLGNHAFVVLYGYDLHTPEDPILPIAPQQYQARLNTALTELLKVADETQTPIMGGLPVIATTYEWEQKIVDSNDPSKNLTSAYRQIDYFTAALNTYRQVNSPRYLGFSIWGFVSNTKPQTYLPYTISQKEWQLMSNNSHLLPHHTLNPS